MKGCLILLSRSCFFLLELLQSGTTEPSKPGLMDWKQFFLLMQLTPPLCNIHPVYPHYSLCTFLFCLCFRLLSFFVFCSEWPAAYFFTALVAMTVKQIWIWSSKFIFSKIHQWKMWICAVFQPALSVRSGVFEESKKRGASWKPQARLVVWFLLTSFSFFSATRWYFSCSLFEAAPVQLTWPRYSEYFTEMRLKIPTSLPLLSLTVGISL